MKKDLMLSIIQKRWIMLCLFVMMCVFGYYSWTQLSIEAYPDIADVTSQVVTQVPGLAAEEVEQQITIPLERAINGLPGMHVMRSKSTFGLSMITIVFKDGTEDYWSRQRVQERLNEVELPYGAAPGLDPLTSPVGEVYRYIIESDQHSLRELTDLQNWVVIPRIKEVSGVADVTNFGGITTQFQVEIDPYKLEQYHLSLSQVIEAIENNNASVGGSILNRGDLGYVVRGIGLIENLDDLGHIVVTTTSGVPVFLNDIGSLKYGNLERKGVLGYTDRTRDYSESLEGIVLLLKHENPSKVLDGIHAAVDELNHEILPEGVRIHTFLDRTSLVDTTLDTVSHTLLMGMALVVIVLVLFLGNWRGALLVSITIPVSLLIAFILMHFTDIPANLLSLGAIDFGIIVDGAIVMLETILKKREDYPEQYIEEKSIAQRAKEVGRPILFSTIVIITAYLPLFAFERVERKLFTPMAFTMSYAMIGALSVALLLIPGLAYAIYRKPRKVYKNKWLEKLKEKYTGAIEKLIQKPVKTILFSCLILIAGIVLSGVVGKAIAQLYQGDRQYDITCKYKEEMRDTPEKIAGLMLTSSTGAKIPLSQVAEVKLSVGESTITREMNRRHLTVKLNLRGRDLASFLKEAQNVIDAKVDYDKSKYTVKWGGAFENQHRAYTRLSVILPLTLMCMFILLYATFGKFRQAGLVLSIVPLALFGGMLALNVRGMTLNVSSAVGFIAMFGLSIQNGIIMVSQINNLRKGGMELRKSVIEGARQRFRPILMTSVTTVLGLFPASLATGIGSDVQRPLATVIVYGLMFSALISMFVLPVFYYLIENNVLNKKKNDEKEYAL